MTGPKWMSLIGGLLLVAGLCVALLSFRYDRKVMGDAALGYGIIAPNEGTAEDREQRRLRALADRWFWVGLGLTAVGVILQTLGAIF